jgi:hypothetical protein
MNRALRFFAVAINRIVIVAALVVLAEASRGLAPTECPKQSLNDSL